MMQRQRGFHLTSWNVAKALHYFSFSIFFMQNVNSKLASTENVQFAHVVDCGFQTASDTHILPKCIPFHKCSKWSLSVLYPLIWQHSAAYQQPKSILAAFNSISSMQLMPNFKKMHINFKRFWLYSIIYLLQSISTLAPNESKELGVSLGPSFMMIIEHQLHWNM